MSYVMKNHASLLLSIALLGGFCAGCSRSTSEEVAAAVTIQGDRVTFPEHSPQRMALTVAAAEPQAQSVRHVTGRIIWNENATVRIFAPVEGRVQSIAVEVGARVNSGAELARISSPDFGQAQADLRKAEADLRLAEQTLVRTRDLFEHGAQARKDLEAAEDAQAGAQAEQQRAGARLKRYDQWADLKTVDGLYTLHSPLAGVVAEKNINVGQEVRPDLMLANDPKLLAPQFVVTDPTSLWVLLDVTEMDMPGLDVGQTLRISSRGLPGRVFPGRLENIGLSLDPATRTVRARGAVENTDLLLKEEMYVDVEIELPAKSTTTVAIASNAVFTKDARHYVFVETAPGSFVRREVIPGAETQGRILVEHGLQPGERVVVEGGLLVEAMFEQGGRS